MSLRAAGFRAFLTFASLAGNALAAAGPEWKPIVDVRLRAELFDTPAASTTADRGYNFLIGRARLGGELAWGKQFAIRGLLQGAATTALPDRAGFGGGLTYFNTNGGDRTPSQVGLAELAFLWKSDRHTLCVGRQGWADGAGPATGIAHLDFVRARRLAERLVGNLDFANVGRRFDGATLSVKAGDGGTFELFALRPLGGAFNYEQAFDSLDVDVFGLSWATKHDSWIPASSLRLFAQGYQDGREVASRAFGDEVRMETLGGSLLAGGDSWDLLLWAALQQGDLGSRDHSAWAAIVDLGYRFTEVPGKPSIHFGWEQASGGGASGESKNFYNLLPTNHKFYGALDYFAFSNLRDLFLEARWSASEKLSLSAALHDFRLVDRAGPWVGGSGAFSDREVGYQFRRPATGVFSASSLGQELDLSAVWALPRGFATKLEGGLFWGGEAAEQVLPAESDGSWISLELTYKL